MIVPEERGCAAVPATIEPEVLRLVCDTATDGGLTLVEPLFASNASPCPPPLTGEGNATACGDDGALALPNFR
jgi:hypothetical protein